MNVLSLFDGISCGRLALERAGIKVDKYYASEIDPHAIKVSAKNYPDIIQLGNVKNICYTTSVDYINEPEQGIFTNKENLFYSTKIDLLIGGSPCQGFSNAGNLLNFEDPRSKLFFEYVRILGEIRNYNPNIKFFLENVKMKKQWKDIVTQYIGVEPILMNSSLLSGQNRERYYWTNIEGIIIPEDKGILLIDCLETEVDVKLLHTDKAITYLNRTVKSGRNHFDFSHHCDSNDKKGRTLVANLKKGVPFNVLIDRKLYLTDDQLKYAIEVHKSKVYPSGNRKGNMKFPDKVDKKSKCVCRLQIAGARTTTHILDEIGIRKLSVKECARLQTLPDDYVSGIPDTHAYACIGNGWTVDVITHIFSFLKHNTQQ